MHSLQRDKPEFDAKKLPRFEAAFLWHYAGSKLQPEAAVMVEMMVSISSDILVYIACPSGENCTSVG